MIDEPVSLTQLREILAGEGNLPLSRETVSQYVAEGMPKLRRDLYPAMSCLRWYVRRLRAAVQQRATEGEDGKIIRLDEAQLRLILAKAKNEELTMHERTGTLVPLQVYEQELTRLVMTTRSGFLSLASRVSQSLDSVTKQEAKDIVDKAIRSVLQNLSEMGKRASKAKPQLEKKTPRRSRKS